jgi:predicted adenylyl cyclase CyaB
MGTNVEIKARIGDMQRTRQIAESISDVPCQMIVQHDVFFCVDRGRLKLRVLDPKMGQLVYYERQNHAGPRASHYQISVTAEPELLERVLSAALGVRGTVDKRRYLYWVGNTRIHLDEVDGLGHFLELEVVLDRGQSEEQGTEAALALMARLGVSAEDLIDVAYIDLLEMQRWKA